MEKKTLDKETLARRLAQLEDELQIEPLIRDNKIEFPHKKSTFRVRKPKVGESLELNQKRAEQKIILLKRGNIQTKKQIIALLEKEGVDLGALEKKMITLQKKHDNLLDKMLKIEDKNVRAKLEQQVLDIRDEKNLLSMEKNDYLEGSLEQQLDAFSNSYLLFLTLEEKIKKGWKRVFGSYEELKNSDNLDLLYKASNYSQVLSYYGI